MIDRPDSKPTLADLVSQVIDLVSLPDVYIRIKAILDDPTATLEDISEALNTDPAIAARLLRMANSAYYGRPGSFSTVSRAVGLLGTQQVHDLVLATSVIDSFNGIPTELTDMRRFWLMSLFAGSAAKLLAEHCGILDCERLFVSGLLARIGELVLYQQLPEAMAQILDTVRQTQQPVAAIERERLGFDYAEIGAELFTLWRLPLELVAPIRHHLSPSQTREGRLEAAILHVAVELATADQGGQPLSGFMERLDDAAWRIIELTPEQLQDIADSAGELANEVSAVLLQQAA